MGNGSFRSANGSWDGSLYPVRGDMVFIGTDLSNDHPISMQYGGGGINSGAIAGATVDPDFAQAAGAATAIGTAPATGQPGGLILVPGGATSNAGVGDTTGAVNGSGTGVVAHYDHPGRC